MFLLVAVYMWPVAGAGHFPLLCLHPGLHAQQEWIVGSRYFSSAIVGVPAPVLAGLLAQIPVPSLAPVPVPCPWLVILRLPRPPWLAWFVWRATTSFAFTVASFIVSLATVAMICAIAARSLAVAITKFAIDSTV